MTRCPKCGAELEEAPKKARGKDRSDEVREVIQHYRMLHPRAPAYPCGSKEYQKVRARLEEGFSVGDLCQAIDGQHRSPHHLGQNATGTKYLSLELAMRDGSHVQNFMEMGPVTAPLSKTNATTALALAKREEERRGVMPPGGEPPVVTGRRGGAPTLLPATPPRLTEGSRAGRGEEEKK